MHIQVKIKNHQLYYHNPITRQDIPLALVDVDTYQEIGWFYHDPSLYYNIDQSLHSKAEQTELFYFKDKNHLYLISHFYSSISLEPEICIFQLIGIDIDTFTISQDLEGYAKDKDGVYFRCTKIQGLDPNQVHHGEEIESISYKKFTMIEHKVLYTYIK